MAPKPVDGKTLPGKAAPAASDKPKKGRKRKNPVLNENGEEVVHTGPGRPRKNGTTSTTTASNSKVKKTTPVKEKKEPKKKYAKLTKEEREARKATKKAAAEEAKKNKKIKKADKANVKAKEKPPVDIEKQCGVLLANGSMCARSLTCKSHSMGAKRSVPGRSKPYDVLLAAYQKRNQIKLAELSTQQQIDLENEVLGMSSGPLNEDEEVEQVMAGVFLSRPVPLETRVVMPVRMKNKFFQMREMLIGSLTTLQPLPQAKTLTPEEEAKLTPAQVASNTRLQVMSATSGILGRSLVFDSTTGAQSMRPSRAYINMMQQQQQARFRQAQLMQMQKLQMQQAQLQQQAQMQQQNQLQQQQLKLQQEQQQATQL